MKDTERKDLVNAVLASRDEIDPELETELLKAIVDAEIDSALGGDAAMDTIAAALTSATNRGIGDAPKVDAAEATEDDVNGDGENEENGA